VRCICLCFTPTSFSLRDCTSGSPISSCLRPRWALCVSSSRHSLTYPSLSVTPCLRFGKEPANYLSARGILGRDSRLCPLRGPSGGVFHESIYSRGASLRRTRTRNLKGKETYIQFLLTDTLLLNESLAASLMSVNQLNALACLFIDFAGCRYPLI
jgi:hypothetical protein